MTGSRFQISKPLAVLLLAIVVAGGISMVWGFLRYKSLATQRKSTGILPSELRAYFEIEHQASTYRLQGNYREALASYERLARLNLPPKMHSLTDSAQTAIAECYLGLGEPAKAEQIYGSLLARSPSDEGLLREVGTYWKTRGELEKALELFLRARAVLATDALIPQPTIIPDGSAVITFRPENNLYYSIGEIARLQFCLGNHAAAKNAFEEIIKADPEHCSAEVREAVAAIECIAQSKQSLPCITNSDDRWNLRVLIRIVPADEKNSEDVFRYLNEVLLNLPRSIHRSDDMGVYLPLIRKACRRHPEVLWNVMQVQSRRTNREILSHAAYGLEHGQEEQPKLSIQETAELQNPAHRESTEAEMTKAEANYFIMQLLSTQALDLVEMDVHSHDVSMRISTNSTGLKYPLEGLVMIHYESKTNSITYYQIEKAEKTKTPSNIWELVSAQREPGSSKGWTVLNGWTIENGVTNRVRDLPAADIQQWASRQGILIAWSFELSFSKAKGE